MFAVHLTLKKREVLFFVSAAVLAVVCVIAVIHATRGPRETAQSENGATYSLNVKNDGYNEFFSRLGLEAESQPTEEDEVRIPGEFNGEYDKYNELQRRSGLDLTPYRGKQIRRLTFALHGANENECAVLLVLDGRVIGGHITSGEYGAEMSALTDRN